jgi:hypothetical protein
MTDTADNQEPPADLAEAAPTSPGLVERLHLTAERIAEWRADAVLLRGVLADSEGPVDPALLLAVEEATGKIYREIEAFDAIVANIDKKSHAAAGQIASVGDALRLVLMEITELGTAMYSRQSIPVDV